MPDILRDQSSFSAAEIHAETLTTPSTSNLLTHAISGVPIVLNLWLLLWLTLLPGVASAAPAVTTDRPFTTTSSVRDTPHFVGRLEITTILPYLVGGGVSFEAPGDIRFGTTVGVTPGLFIDMAQNAVGAVQYYDQEVAAVVLDRLEDPLLWRIDLGWAPEAAGGFYFTVGYGFGRLSARFDAGDAPPSWRERLSGMTEDSTASVAATLHLVHADVGWELDLGDDWLMKVSVGGSFTFAASSAIHVGESTEDPAEVAEGADEVEAEINDVLVRYGRAPTIGVALVYRLY